MTKSTARLVPFLLTVGLFFSGATARAQALSFDLLEVDYQAYRTDPVSHPDQPGEPPFPPVAAPGRSATDFLAITGKMIPFTMDFAQAAGPDYVGTMHAICTRTTDEKSIFPPRIFIPIPGLGWIDLLPAGFQVPPIPAASILRCTQSLVFNRGIFGQHQIQLDGTIDNSAFESGQAAYLSVTGGSGDFARVRGYAEVTQVGFPNKKRVRIFLTPNAQ